MEEKDTNDVLESVMESILTCPLPLLSIKNPIIIQAINDFFPYSHGMEFECFMRTKYKIEYFKSIPNIMSVNVDDSEQRYRIPSGLNGLICLWDICKNMKRYSALDLASSNHYHTDLSDVFDRITDEFAQSTQSYIIPKLKEWKTTRSEQCAHINSWYKFNGLKTLEVRIGEPTFDYNIIVKRLIQCNELVNYIKQSLDNIKVLELQRNLELIIKDNSKPVLDIPQSVITTTINKHIIKI